jgi:hypothetical protein
VVHGGHPKKPHGPHGKYDKYHKHHHYHYWRHHWRGGGHRYYFGARRCFPGAYGIWRCWTSWCGWYLGYCGAPRYWYRYWPFRYPYTRYYYGYATRPWYSTFSKGWYSPPAAVSEPCPWTLAEAWDLLAEGRPGAAQDAFDCLAEALPDDGLPLVGYALAAAVLDLNETAIEAMRDALYVDPDSLRYVPDDERLHQQMVTLAERFEHRARQQYGDADALFMVAALRYLLDQLPAAYYAIDVAITIGDEDPSTLSLEQLIAE